MGIKNMQAAKRNKNDEFYTRLTDIEKELKHYKAQFKDKVVYCNCDDPSEDYDDMSKGSQFWNYFYMQFEHLGLKKLIATHYNKGKPSYKMEYEGGGVENIIKTPLEDDGDFRSEESIELLKEADIVCTNPPFSLFREYVAQLMEYEKDFLVIGNFNAVTYKEIFPLLKNEKMWLGYTAPKEFLQPDGSIKRFGNITWFTNLEVKRRKEFMNLYHSYKGNEDKYPKYDNYDAIEVSRVSNIPKDYEGVMGVPITFLEKHTPMQFEIIGLGNSRHNFTPNKIYKKPKKVKSDGSVVSGSAINNVLTLVSETAPKGKVYYLGDDGEIILPPYARVLIKNKNPETENGKEV